MKYQNNTCFIQYQIINFEKSLFKKYSGFGDHCQQIWGFHDQNSLGTTVLEHRFPVKRSKKKESLETLPFRYSKNYS
jgi:hypothetical protein